MRWEVLVWVLSVEMVSMNVVSERSPWRVPFMVPVNKNRAVVPEGSPS